MKANDACRIKNWQIRYPDPETEYGSRRPEIIGTFLAIKEHKNCTLKPDYQQNVALMGFVYNYPGRKAWDEKRIMTADVVKVEHLLLDEEIEKQAKEYYEKLAFKSKNKIRWKKERKIESQREKNFVTVITTKDGMSYVLGDIGQPLGDSADPINWNLLQGAKGYKSDDCEDEPRERSFEDFATYFENVNEDYRLL